MGDELEGSAFPKMKPMGRGSTKANTQRRAMAVEMAAMAFVAMENGDYRFPEGTRRPDKDGDGVHRAELMRLAGYSPGSYDQYTRTLGKDEDFLALVELYRLRRTDPMFRKEQEHMLLGKVMRNLSLQFYEITEYAPHTLSIRDIINAMKAIVDMGYTVSKSEGVLDNRTNKLLDSLPEDQRQQAIEGLRNKAKSDLAAIESLEKAHQAADDH
jgi:hypothetical protein